MTVLRMAFLICAFLTFVQANISTDPTTLIGLGNGWWQQPNTTNQCNNAAPLASIGIISTGSPLVLWTDRLLLSFNTTDVFFGLSVRVGIAQSSRASWSAVATLYTGMEKTGFSVVSEMSVTKSTDTILDIGCSSCLWGSSVEEIKENFSNGAHVHIAFEPKHDTFETLSVDCVSFVVHTTASTTSASSTDTTTSTVTTTNNTMSTVAPTSSNNNSTTPASTSSSPTNITTTTAAAATTTAMMRKRQAATSTATTTNAGTTATTTTNAGTTVASTMTTADSTMTTAGATRAPATPCVNNLARFDMRLVDVRDIAVGDTLALENCGVRVELDGIGGTIQQQTADTAIGVGDSVDAPITEETTMQLTLSDWVIPWTFNLMSAERPSGQLVVGDTNVNLTENSWLYIEWNRNTGKELPGVKLMQLKAVNGSGFLLQDFFVQTNEPMSTAAPTETVLCDTDNQLELFMCEQPVFFWVIVALLICCVLVICFAVFARCYIKKSSDKGEDYSMRDAASLDYCD